MLSPRALLGALLLAVPASAQTPAASPSPVATVPAEYVEVTATRIAEDPEEVPAAVEVVSGEELRARGATDLRTALALATGVDIAPGADQGPAASVPEFWGLKEFDAFLLVVDGVPWGGTFNPALETLSLVDVERIEILRGAAPVMYGTTSFVGVIHVIHRPPGSKGGAVSLFGGNYSSAGGTMSVPLSSWKGIDSTLNLDFEKQGFRDDRTEFKRGHALFRSRRTLSRGVLRLDLDGTWLNQTPGSPRPLDGTAFSNAVPQDTNNNPDGAFLNNRRYAASAGYDHSFTAVTWSSLFSFAHSTQDIFRGFLVNLGTTPPNAHGFREQIGLDDLYFDSHWAWTRSARLKVVAGVDYLHGKGSGRGGDFDYLVNLDGTSPPGSSELPPAADIQIHDRRAFAGIYAFLEWSPDPAWRVELGGRLNRTAESRDASTLDLGSGDRAAGQSQLTKTRPGATAAFSWTPWSRGKDRLRFYGSYRNSYKPGAIDFGLDTKPQILKPETAESYEAGLKSRMFDGAVAVEIESFLMDFKNLVVSQNINGLPTLANAGAERFRGVEASLAWELTRGWAGRATYSLHDARFRDFASDFGNGVVQLAGFRLPMSAHHMATAGIHYAAARGLFGHMEVGIVGSRFLDRLNTALTPAYATLSAGVGYRAGEWEVRVEGRNLSNRREPVSASELGDGQYYLLPARRVNLTLSRMF
jgi:outer membrane receptor protein involved in Fe transport